MMSLSSRRLVHWARLHDKRSARGRALGIAGVLVLGLALAAALLHRSPHDLTRVWAVALVLTTALSFVTTPFRLFWSSDAAALARQPISGRPLYRLGVTRNLSAALGFAVPPALGVLAAAWHDPAHGLRLTVLLAGAVSVSMLLAPATAFAAGAAAASARAEAIGRSLGGEMQVPRGAYLGVIPGLVGAGAVLGLVSSVPWAVSGDGAPIGVLVTAAAGALAAALADARAEAVMPQAVRELSALNRTRLAHVERTRLSLLEAGFCRLLPGAMAAFAGKDLRLLRRRYPAFFLFHGLAVIVAWSLAWRMEEPLEWIATILVAVHSYSVVMFFRASFEPIELTRLAHSLPASFSGLGTVKLAALVLRTIVFSATIGGALFLRVDWQMATLVTAASGVATMLVGVALKTRQPRA